MEITVSNELPAIVCTKCEASAAQLAQVYTKSPITDSYRAEFPIAPTGWSVGSLVTLCPTCIGAL